MSDAKKDVGEKTQERLDRIRRAVEGDGNVIGFGDRERYIQDQILKGVSEGRAALNWDMADKAMRGVKDPSKSRE